MRCTRREFLCTGAATATLAVAPTRRVHSKPSCKTLPIGIQLFAVRGACYKDYPGTIEALAEMGFQGIEFFGYSGKSPNHRSHSPRELRKLLDDNGLRCCGMHVSLPAIKGRALENTIQLNTALANELVIVSAAKNRIVSSDSVKRLADEFSDVAEQVKPHGLRIGYHADGFDCQTFDGRAAWDILFSHASPDVVMQMDVANCLDGGADPIAIMRKFAARAASLHVRELSEQPLRTDNPFWKELLHLAKSAGALKWLVVEQGGRCAWDLKIPRSCLQRLRQMRV